MLCAYFNSSQCGSAYDYNYSITITVLDIKDCAVFYLKRNVSEVEVPI
jgi:hypothetical protein